MEKERLQTPDNFELINYGNKLTKKLPWGYFCLLIKIKYRLCWRKV